MAGRRTTAEAVEDFLESTPKSWALSLARAAREIRNVVPHCELTDRELADLVASHALAMGFPVLLFDTTAPEIGRRVPGGDTAPGRPGGKVIAFVPELQRAAYQITRDQKKANRLVERVLTLAISTIDHRPQDQSVEEWLLGLIRNFGSPSRTRH
ncbi:hypothetical protein KEU06_28070 [Pseudaminobacter sp. 19-2017]|uniref:Uncharacterized protein n=1 Tax=Pseudaminobacter soli (ex Zhang et al. 2022) TaxID=2831468 RepID=A0A942E6Y0_9HYPH|nr:hypothetical protein [Pseudaminobacter soli]MBS3652450.1 hypothetical protein [Pseudaminobacter soli]